MVPLAASATHSLSCIRHLLRQIVTEARYYGFQKLSYFCVNLYNAGQTTCQAFVCFTSGRVLSVEFLIEHGSPLFYLT